MLQVSCTKPAGRVTLGNSIGARSHWTPVPKIVLAVMDPSAITASREPDNPRASILEVPAALAALEPRTKGGVVFVQSGVSTRSEMA